jgi:erythromycin esterase-like protein
MTGTLDVIRHAAFRFEIEEDGFEPLLEDIGDAQIVLIGEASHGTHEFYEARAALTRALIARKGFTAVAVEADWPDAYRVNRWVRHLSADATADAALGGFQRFPRWMWRNTVTVEFLDWLHDRNRRRPPEARAGFYGLDLYSLHTSIDAVLTYLRSVDPEAAERARFRYGCFEDFGEDPQAYGYAATIGLTRSCEDEAVRQLVDLQRRASQSVPGSTDADDRFAAEQNARLVRNAEQYYRAMFRGNVESWNLRDMHMMETLEALLQHLGQPRVVVWAHNSHLGDARATYMGRIGEQNLGQLVRQRFGDSARLIGFTTHRGTVTAASNWDEPEQRMHVRTSLEGSYERLFHETGLGQFLLVLRGEVRAALMVERLERAIGVIYRPDTERTSHYFEARLPDQFDAVMHIDETTAVEPLERWPVHTADLPETYPSAL